MAMIKTIREKKLEAEIIKLKSRIRALWDLIQYNEDIVQEACDLQATEGVDEAMEHIERNFVIADDDLIDRIEKA